MSQQKLESALWRACLYIVSSRNCSEEAKKHIADSLYDFFLKGYEGQRFEYELEKFSKQATEMVVSWPQWKREFVKYNYGINEPREPY